MFSKDLITPQKNNSEVVKQVLNTLIYTIKRKKNEEYAVSMMRNLIKKLRAEYDFLQYVNIQDTRFLEKEDTVNVIHDINDVSPTEVGKALHKIISKLSLSLEDKDGFFLIREFQQRVGDEYT